MVRPVARGEMADWEVSDELWARIKPLLPVVERRSRYPGRRRLDDRACLNGILFVLVTGVRWDRLPPQLGYGSGVTCGGGCATAPRPGSGTACTSCSWPSCTRLGASTGPGPRSMAPMS